MAANAVRMTLPSELSPNVLAELLDDVRSREQLLRSQVAQFEIRYAETLPELEARLDRGEGQEHPDWEDSIAWRNSVEALNRP